MNGFVKNIPGTKRVEWYHTFLGLREFPEIASFVVVIIVAGEDYRDQ
jgi:hypothetical protein